MTVLERSELEASTLADLHTIANQIGVDGFRRLRKAELIDAILNVEAESSGAGAPLEAPLDGSAEAEALREKPFDESSEAADSDAAEQEPGARSLEEPHGDEISGSLATEEPTAEEAAATARKRRFGLLRRARADSASRTGEDADHPSEAGAGAEGAPQAGESVGSASEAGESAESASEAGESVGSATEAGESAESASEARESTRRPSGARKAGERRSKARAGGERPSEVRRDSGDATVTESSEEAEPERSPKPARAEELVEGTVELLANGSAFLRVDPSGSSDSDVYVSAAQVRRCELAAGDRVAGPIRLPRRSERHPSLVRVETINGVSAEAVAEAPRYEELTAVFPERRLALEAEDATLTAIDSFTPIGLGSRVVISGPAQVGKTETLRRLVGALAAKDGLELSLVLLGIRPEELADWRAASLEPAAALSFVASPETQGQALERVIDAAKRVAARGGDALVVIDTLDGLPPTIARKAMAAARNLAEAGSLTVIATASTPLRGETTVIALDRRLAAAGRRPPLDLLASGTLKAERLVGEEGARAIDEARAAAAGG